MTEHGSVSCTDVQLGHCLCVKL